MIAAFAIKFTAPDWDDPGHVTLSALVWGDRGKSPEPIARHVLIRHLPDICGKTAFLQAASRIASDAPPSTETEFLPTGFEITFPAVEIEVEP